jgi:tRNA threonylcarbamoyladenosine biosynthesis protein TsaE
MTLTEWQTTTDSETATRARGQIFGELAKAGMVVLLNGALGAGKTCFAQGVGAGLGVPSSAPVTSPSYTLLNIHVGRLPLYHFDLYRLSRVEDLSDLGYDEYAEGEGLTLVEWASRMNGPLAACIEVDIERVSDQQRRIRFAARDEQGAVLLSALADQWDRAATTV